MLKYTVSFPNPLRLEKASDRDVFCPQSSSTSMGEWIIKKGTEDWTGRVHIGGKTISNLRNADDTILLANTEQEIV